MASDGPPSFDLERLTEDWLARSGFEAMGIVHSGRDPDNDESDPDSDEELYLVVRGER